MKKRKLRFICCLLTALAVFLAAAVTVWAVGKEVDELQIDSLSETAEVKIVSRLFFSDPDLKADPETGQRYPHQLPEAFDSELLSDGIPVLCISGTEDGSGSEYMGFAMNLFSDDFGEGSFDAAGRAVSDQMYHYSVNSLTSKVMELGFCGQESIWEQGRGRNGFQAQLSYLRTAEGKTAYMASCIVLAELQKGVPEAEFISWEPAAELLKAVKEEPDLLTETVKLSPEIPEVFYENGRQWSEELELQADSRNGIVLELEEDLQLHRDGKIFTGIVTIHGGERFRLSAPAGRKAPWMSSMVSGILRSRKVLGIDLQGSTGYDTVPDVSFCIWEEGSSFQLSVPFGICGTLEITARGNDGSPLEGLMFQAVHEVTGETRELKTNRDGRVLQEGLTCGNWNIIQEAGIRGYLRSKESYRMELTEKGGYLTIFNEKIVPEITAAVKADRTEGIQLENGRYVGDKQAGWYEPGEMVRYHITVTNLGNVPVYQVKLTSLAEDQWEVLIDREGSGWLDEAGAPRNESGEITAEEILLPGESAEIQYGVLLRDNAGYLEMLKQDVQASALFDPEYEISEEHVTDLDCTIPVPENEDDTDCDWFWIKTPMLQAAVHADRTTGVVLQDGRYVGSRIPGAYRAGETVVYTITVSNIGNAAARQVKVSDCISAELKQWAEQCRFAESQERMITWKGRENSFFIEDDDTLVMECLEAGDAADMIYEVKLMEKTKPGSNLKNEVFVAAENVSRDEDDADMEFVSLMDSAVTETPEERNSGKTGVALVYTGDSIEWHQWIVSAVIMAAGTVFLAAIKRLTSVRNKQK